MNLPASVAEKFRQLEQSAADHAALASATVEVAERFEVDFHNAARRKKFAEASRDAEQIAIEDAALAKARAALDRAAGERLQRQDAAHAAQHVHARASKWLSELRPDRGLEPVAVEPITPRKGETPADVLARLRAQIAEAQAEMRETEAAPLPSKELRRIVRDYVSTLAKEAALHVNPRTGEIIIGGVPSILNMLCTLSPGSVLAVCGAQIDKIPQDAALSSSDKATRLKELRKQLDALERQEELAVMAAVASGHIAIRRPDASVQAILQVRVTKVKAAQAAAA